MLRSVLSVCAIFVLLLPAFFLPAPVSACPVDIPETLLALYRTSDAIYIGTYDKITEHEVIEDTTERTILNTKRHFDISSTLKGEPRKLLTLDETDYRYKNFTEPPPGASDDVAAPAVEADEAEEASPEEYDLYRSPVLNLGDRVLLFLRNDPDSDGLMLAHYRDGIKKMVDRDRLDAYETRIRELNSIFSEKKVDNAAIVDWLVRCAHDPFTRWEGAFELQRSFQELDWRLRQEQERNEQAAEGNTAGSEQTGAGPGGPGGEGVEVEEFDRSVYARLLTDGHKQELINTLVDMQTVSDGKKIHRITPGDRALINVVTNWGDSRFARFLLDRIQAAPDDPYFVSELMSTVANIIGDEQLQSIASRYSEVYYEDAGEFVVDKGSASEERGAREETAAEPPAPETAKTGASPASSGAETPDAVERSEPVRKRTYKELREELVASFLARGAIAVDLADARQKERASN